MTRNHVRKLLACAGIAATLFAADAAPATYVVEDAPGYNCWPMIQNVGGRLVNVYTVGKVHEPAEKGRATYARYSDDGGVTWSERRLIFQDARCGTSSIGKGLDRDGNALFWVRRLGIEPRMALYRTGDGIGFELVSAPKMEPAAMQITDIFGVPGGLACLWFSDDYSASRTNKSWGVMSSEDNGRTWCQRVVEKDLALPDWPTEPSVAVLGGGRLLCIARSEGNGNLFQLESEDWGKTWTRTRTNIGDICYSTPSVLHDKGRGVLYVYYFQRGAGVLKLRTARVDEVWSDPLRWGESEVVAYGGKHRIWDSGNANAVDMDGRHYVTYYAGNETNCSVLVAAVPGGTERVRTEIRSSLMGRFFDRRTEMLYDVLWKLPDGTTSATALLPTPEEISRQYPNPCAWGVGMQDCVFNGAPLLLSALAAGDRDLAFAAYRGLRRCAEVSGIPGFVSRGVSPADGRSCYSNSSRDTFTLFVWAMYRFYRHPFADAATKREIARMLVDVARYAEKCAVKEHGYSLLRADGRPGIVGRLWMENPGKDGLLAPHEALRLPMFYAAAYAVTGDSRWREAELKYADDGIRISEGKHADDLRGSILDQMQVSVRLLWECETDAARKARYGRLLARNADFAAEKLVPRLIARAARTGWTIKEPLEDWRKFPFQPGPMKVGGLEYLVPDSPVSTIEEPYVELAHAVLVESLAPERTVSRRTAEKFMEVTGAVDFRRSVCANLVNAWLASYAPFRSTDFATGCMRLPLEG